MPPSKTQLAWERAGHIGLGFVSGLLPLYLLMWLREWRQLPPENDRYPVFVFTEDTILTASGGKTMPWPIETEYWAAPRVRDTLTDLRDKMIGFTVAWFFVLSSGIAIGWGIWG